MTSINQQLTDLLLSDERLKSQEGQLLKNLAQELARKNDPELISLLLSEQKIKDHFFIDVDGTLIFDKEKFIRFITSKQFLPESYTAFKNKIGLTVGDEYIDENKDVVLVWPYKDCVLEGGMTKEDQKRNEVFFNETLAPEEINRLYDPKVFKNFKRYHQGGEYSLERFNYDRHSIKDNFLIRGNNLLVISSLLNSFAGCVDLIYIDPPFNTGSDSFNYNDKFNHSTWLTFMKNRLSVAQKLLKASGSIFIHIDINESHYLKVVCDEIFGRDNFVEEIIWSYGSPSGGRAAGAKPVNIHDYILHYCKSYTKRKEFEVYTQYSDKYIRDWFKYEDPDGRRYRRRMRNRDEQGNVEWEKQYLDESKGLPLTTVWTDIKQVYADPRAYKENQKNNVELIKGFPTQKPEKLIQRILDMATEEGDIVLDFHLGSGTTAAVAHKMNRQYIGVEQLDYGEDDSVYRLKNILDGAQTGISKAVGWQSGGSFIYMELAKWNQAWIDKIEAAVSSDELVRIWEEMNEKAFLSYKVDPKTINENAKEFKDLSITDQKIFLIECLDKNHLYINYSEIEDQDYGLTEEEIRLNREFYNQYE